MWHLHLLFDSINNETDDAALLGVATTKMYKRYQRVEYPPNIWPEFDRRKT